MNNRIFTLLFFLLFCFVAEAQKHNTIFSDELASQESKNFIQKSTFQESQNSGLYDLIYQRMEWEVDPGIRYIKGEITSYFKSNSEDLNEIEFDLNNALNIDSITHNNQRLEFNHEENKILIQLNNILQVNQIDSVSIFYKGEPANTGFGSFTKSEHSGVPIIWTLSEPYGAMNWWPCKQSLSDKIDSIDVIVTTPEMYRTASNGILVSDTVKNGNRTMHWKHRFPIATYLVAIAVTNYTSYSDFVDLGDGRNIEILNYVYPEYLEEAQEGSPVTIQIMQLYNEIIGEYPFASEKYGHAQFGWGGGMEHQTMSFMGSFYFNLIAHELAHQWFGDYITLNSWQDIWLNEGFATYLTGLTYENLKSNLEWHNWKKNNVELITVIPGGSVFVTDTADVGRIFSSRLSYKKGAHLLHMLRWILGDEHFFEGIQNYVNDPVIANGFASHKQLVYHFESSGDTSLTEFFNDWYYGEGYPIYSVNYIQENSESLKIQLIQTSSHESVSFFEMPVPVRVFSLDDNDSVDFILNNKVNGQEFIVNPGFKIGRLEIDPEYWLISKTAEIVNVPLAEDIEQIKIYPNPFNNILNILIPLSLHPTKINLYSSDGKLLNQFKSDINSLDLSEFSNGIFILQIESDKGIFEKKIIKQ